VFVVNSEHTELALAEHETVVVFSFGGRLPPAAYEQVELRCDNVIVFFSVYVRVAPALGR
jgi:hypothetical protein